MDFLGAQLPRGIAHAAGATAGLFGSAYVPLPPPVNIGAGTYLGSYAYDYATSDGGASFMIRQDTIGGIVGALAGFYFPVLGGRVVSVAAGAFLGDIAVSWVLG